MKEIVIASRNPKKIAEIKEILKDTEVRIQSLLDYPQLGEIQEDGKTFTENATKKARIVAGLTGKTALADDSGLEVDALGGAPGVYSARFAGEGATDSANNEKLLSLMRDVPYPERSARFVCVLALARPDGHIWTVEGQCSGIIATSERGSGGFGYDPLFIVPEYGKTFAELGDTVKNRISHRAVALQKLRDLVGQLEDCIEGAP